MTIQVQENTLVFDVTRGGKTETPPIAIPEKMSVLFISASGIATGYVTIYLRDGEFRRSFIVGSGIGGFALDLITNSLGGPVNEIKAFTEFSFLNGGTHQSAIGDPINLPAPTTGLVIVQFKDRS